MVLKSYEFNMNKAKESKYGEGKKIQEVVVNPKTGLPFKRKQEVGTKHFLGREPLTKEQLTRLKENARTTLKKYGGNAEGAIDWLNEHWGLPEAEAREAITEILLEESIKEGKGKNLGTFTTMNANSIFEGAADVKEIVKQLGMNEGQFCLAVQVSKWGSAGQKVSHIFICGAGDKDDLEAYGKVGDTAIMKQDTGNGYKKTDNKITIENAFFISPDGSVSVTNSINHIGVNEKRRVWVFK